MSGVQGNPLPFSATDVTEEFDPNLIRRIIDALRSINNLAYREGSDVRIVGAPDAAGRRQHLYLRSPDGNTWQVNVDDAGLLSTTLVPFNPVATRGATSDL